MDYKNLIIRIPVLIMVGVLNSNIPKRLSANKNSIKAIVIKNRGC